MNIVGIIPARMQSSRFPGKPLAKIAGIPMIRHVYCRSKMASVLSGIYIATCDKEIKDYCLENRMNAIMTSSAHARASDRTAEAMLKIEKETGKKIDIVVMIQGDEPMIVPGMIDSAVGFMLKDKTIFVANLMSKIKTKDEYEDLNTIKVVVDRNNFALYFSREPIPSNKRAAGDLVRYKQVCIIPFRRDFLIKFNKLTPTSLEIVESIDMLRILENGYRVKMVLSQFETYSVDTIDDLKKVENVMKNDPLIKRYGKDV